MFKRHSEDLKDPEDVQSPKDIFGIFFGRLLDMHAMWEVSLKHEKCRI